MDQLWNTNTAKVRCAMTDAFAKGAANGNEVPGKARGAGFLPG